MENIKTGFWIRCLSRLLDLILVASIVVTSAYFMMDHGARWHFRDDYLFYIWILEFIALIFIAFILVPFLTKGYTLFMWVFRIKIIFETDKIFTSIIKRELFFSIYWIIMAILVMAIINHTLIDKYALVDQDKVSYSNLEKLRMSTVTAVGSILIVIQFIYAMSIFVRGSRKGLHDTQSKTWTVWVNKFKDIPKEKEMQTIKPRPVNNNPVIWVKENNE